MEVPRLGVESELQLPAYTTAVVTPDPSPLQPIPQLTATPDPWARPGIEPETSWFLVGFISAAPRWELHASTLLSRNL